MNAPVKAEKIAMNGVDVPMLLTTIGVVNENREAAKFTFRATGEWMKGTHSRVRINGFFGAGAEQGRENDLMVEGDHPAVLCGGDNAPTPVELLLAALSTCITAGIGNIASARQIKLQSVETSVEGEVNLLGLLGLDETVRNGYSAIRMTVKIRGDAPSDKLRHIVEQSVARSAVYDVLTNGVSVSIAADTD